MPNESFVGPQLALFLDVAQVLSQEYVGELSRWNGSPFQWLIGLAPRRKGAIGEKLIDVWLQRNGFTVRRPKHTGCDRIVEGYNFEVKLSTLWGSGIYTFQQLRNQDYAYVFCLGKLCSGADFGDRVSLDGDVWRRRHAAAFGTGVLLV